MHRVTSNKSSPPAGKPCTGSVHLTADEAEGDTAPEVKLNGLRSFLIGCR